MDLIEPLITAILPVLAIAGVGYVAALSRDVNVEPLSFVALYILLPALVFHSIATSEINPEIALSVIVGAAAFTGIMYVLAEIYGQLSALSGPVRDAFVVMAIFPNVGNFGLPLADFAFGSVGREMAVLFIVTHSLLLYTLGIYVASRDAASSLRAAILRIFKLPLIYAMLLAIVLRVFGSVPSADSALMGAVQITGDASIPLMLLILGIQLARIRRDAPAIHVAESTILKLVIAPLLALPTAFILGLPHVLIPPFVVLCSMPSAITPLLFLIEFEAAGHHDASRFGSSVVFTSTVVSLLTISALILLFQSGIIL